MNWVDKVAIIISIIATAIRTIFEQEVSKINEVDTMIILT